MNKRKKITVGKKKLTQDEFYKLMLSMFLRQGKPKKEIRKLGGCKKHQITTFNHESDMLWTFNHGMANFFRAKSSPPLFLNENAAFSYVYKCFTRERRSQLRYLFADMRNMSDWSIIDWRNFSAKNLNGENGVVQVIVGVLRDVRRNKEYTRWERNTICKFILSSAQSKRFIEPKKSRKMQRDFNTKERKYKAIANNELREALSSRIQEDNFYEALLTG